VELFEYIELIYTGNGGIRRSAISAPERSNVGTNTQHWQAKEDAHGDS